MGVPAGSLAMSPLGVMHLLSNQECVGLAMTHVFPSSLDADFFSTWGNVGHMPQEYLKDVFPSGSAGAEDILKLRIPDTIHTLSQKCMKKCGITQEFYKKFTCPTKIPFKGTVLHMPENGGQVVITTTTTTSFSPAPQPLSSTTTTANGVASSTTVTTEGGVSTCGGAWKQCGGSDWKGSTCCEVGSTCKFHNKWYSQCTPGATEKPPAGGCMGVWEQCGGLEWKGPTCCETGLTCMFDDKRHSQCQPVSTQSSSATTATEGAFV